MTAALPAGWSPDTTVLGDQWSVLPADVQGAALSVAVRTLWALSGRQFGVQELTLAPYIPPPRLGFYDGGGLGLRTGGGGVAVVARYGGFGGGCAVPLGRALRLPGPVVSVAEVVVDAVVLGEGAWSLDPDGTLVRTDGQLWPVAQDVYAPRMVIRYTRGIPAPVDGNIAAARYALELGRALTANPACKLPARTRDVARQGISLTLAAPEDLTEAGLTGVPAVDVWLRAVNPAGLAEGAVLLSGLRSRHRILAVHPAAAP